MSASGKGLSWQLSLGNGFVFPGFVRRSIAELRCEHCFLLAGVYKPHLPGEQEGVVADDSILWNFQVTGSVELKGKDTAPSPGKDAVLLHPNFIRESFLGNLLLLQGRKGSHLFTAV